MLVGRVFDHRFRIVRKLGEGGMSRVYAARRLEGEGRVALKVLKADFLRDPEVRKRFMYEARVISNLEHGNAVDLFDFGQAPDGSFYMVMELLEGQSLADRLERGDLTYREIFQFLPPICGVLAEAHEQDVIHRDLKPENIFLARMGGELPVPKLLDFGIAKHLRSRTMTKNDQLWGTPAYMSPEQAAGEEVAGTADIYAMGVMLYELVSGVLPFRASTAMGYATKHMHREPEPISSLPGIRDIPDRLDAFILHMLDKEPGDRPPTMERVVRELRNIEHDVFDERLLGTIPGQQVDESRLEASSEDSEVSPGGEAPEIDDALQEAQTAVMNRDEIGGRPDGGGSVPETPPGGSARSGSEFETQQTGFDDPAGMVEPWFRRSLPVLGLSLLAGVGVVGGYAAYTQWGEGGDEANGETAAAVGEGDEPTEPATKAAGRAANVGIKARTIAMAVAEDAPVEESEPRGSDDEAEPPSAQETVEFQRPPSEEEDSEEEENIETFQLESDDADDPSAPSKGGRTGNDQRPADESSEPAPGGADESSGGSAGESEGGSEENVDEALESTF
jgi:serine/threonine protein kinase